MQRLKLPSATASLVTSSLLTILIAPTSNALTGGMQAGAVSAKGAEQMTDLFGASGIFTTFTSVLLFAVGAISVIMIIIGGLRYVISGGDSSNITAAKNTVLYALIGLIIALLSYAVIRFVLTSFAAGGGVDV